jgi:hypothetical protein
VLLEAGGDKVGAFLVVFDKDQLVEALVAVGVPVVREDTQFSLEKEELLKFKDSHYSLFISKKNLERVGSLTEPPLQACKLWFLKVNLIYILYLQTLRIYQKHIICVQCKYILIFALIQIQHVDEVRLTFELYQLFIP